MATAKQIAARKLFVARVRAGEFAKAKKRKANPSKPAAKKRPAAKSISRPSQITKAKPTKRLKARRAMPAKRGYFPNPQKRPNLDSYGEFKVMYAKNKRFIAIFKTCAEAKEYAEALASKTGKQIAIEFV